MLRALGRLVVATGLLFTTAPGAVTGDRGDVVVSSSTPSVAVGAATPAPEPSATVVASTAPVSPSDATVVLYGDSLAYEARDHFRGALVAAGVGEVRTETFGGTAICDWLDRMRLDALELRPTVVVVEFSGNSLTPCMHDESGEPLLAGSEAYHQRYQQDAAEVLRIFGPSQTRVVFAGSPITQRDEESREGSPPGLNAMYSALQLWFPQAEYADAGSSVLRDGHWTETLPCLASEPCNGGTDANGVAVNVVRAPDGGHFCPGAPEAVRGVTGECPVWSSGAYRYGRAMADAALASLASPAL